VTYATEAASALADITAAGSAVTFAKETPGVYDKTTDTWTDAVDLSVSGFAIATGKDPVLYQALGLVVAETQSLLFAPTTAGAVPCLGSTVNWGAIDYTVRALDTINPDGSAILTRVVISR